VSFFAMGDYWRGIALALWGVLVVAGMEKAMTRFVAEGRDRQHPMAVAAVAVGGTYALGILGVLLIPMVFSVVAAVLNRVHALIS
jgi:hypothetical protein